MRKQGLLECCIHPSEQNMLIDLNEKRLLPIQVQVILFPGMEGMSVFDGVSVTIQLSPRTGDVLVGLLSNANNKSKLGFITGRFFSSSWLLNKALASWDGFPLRFLLVTCHLMYATTSVYVLNTTPYCILILPFNKRVYKSSSYHQRMVEFLLPLR